ncbi:hypothetical protein Tco_1204913 [Tanacetum coccineum]
MSHLMFPLLAGCDRLVYRAKVMSSPSAHTVPETITPTDRARDSPVITPLHDDPYMLVSFPILPFDTPHTDEESEPIEASETRIYCTYDHAYLAYPVTWLLSQVDRGDELLPSSFCKRYISSYKTYSSSASLASSLTLPIRKSLESEESEEEGPGLEVEEAAFEDQQQKAVPVEGTAMDEPRGLGYKAARHRALELAEGPVPIQTSASLVWSSGSLPVSPASLTVQSPIASPVTTLAATIAVDEDEFLEVQAQLELHGSILHAIPSA